MVFFSTIPTTSQPKAAMPSGHLGMAWDKFGFQDKGVAGTFSRQHPAMDATQSVTNSTTFSCQHMLHSSPQYRGRETLATSHGNDSLHPHRTALNSI